MSLSKKHELIREFAERLNNEIELLNDLQDDVDEISNEDCLDAIGEDIDQAITNVHDACTSIRWAKASEH